MSRIWIKARYWSTLLVAGLLAVALVVGLPALTASNAKADESEPVTVSGEFTNDTVVVTGVTIDDDNQVITLTGTQTFTGGLDGTFVFEQTVEIDLATGEVTTEATGTFTGKVDGKQGTHVSRIEAEGNINFVTGVGSIQGEFEILSGTYGTESIEGEGTFEASGTLLALIGTYSAQVQFDP